MDAYRTPPGYFDSLPDRIVARQRARSIRKLWVAATAVAACGAIAFFALPSVFEQQPNCATFACLLEATSTEELLHDALLEELASEPAAFEVLTEDL